MTNEEELRRLSEETQTNAVSEHLGEDLTGIQANEDFNNPQIGERQIVEDDILRNRQAREQQVADPAQGEAMGTIRSLIQDAHDATERHNQQLEDGNRVIHPDPSPTPSPSNSPDARVNAIQNEAQQGNIRRGE